MSAPVMSPPLPGPSLLAALASAVETAAEEAAHRVLGHVPDGDGRDSVLRAFRATGTAANLAAYAVRTEAGSGNPDWENARVLWHTLLNLAGPFHDHPEIPEELRETLAEWEAAEGPRRG
ncbi:hypothetical protein K4749_30820 [Streptomyces sp. TRM72054]|uniref:hypothetical protein n=1 Tax=Streptomyces sp. TRM72054 TaxID=2870562 RepID=UPI001C8C1997|nr:hypothetical protein [Streptomyces sp. TRM72054]MBX9397864.1 hypothetical protein [Streptomyces sp. TRM72054]